jgi:hypothetical protein
MSILCEPRIRKSEGAKTLNGRIELLHTRDRADAYALQRLMGIGCQREYILKSRGA